MDSTTRHKARGGPGVATGMPRSSKDAPWGLDRTSLRSPFPEDGTSPNRRDLAPVTVDRLLRIYDLCAELREDGREFVLSREIAERVGGSSSQVRRDFSRLGELGTRGCGYLVRDLIAVLGQFLGRSMHRDIVLIGAGGLCSVLLGRGIPVRDGLRFAAVFDTNPDMVGAKCGDLVVRDIAEMPKVLKGLRAEVAVLAVPAAKAQDVACLLAENGVRAVLNLTPVELSPGRGVVVRNLDIALELENLVFRASCQPEAGGRRSAANAQ